MPQPNVIFVLADDMGYGDFSAFNAGCSRTPYLDDLFKESVCLTQHYCASCVCAPSRAGLFTGRYPHRTGAIDTLQGRGLDRLALRERTMGDMFQAAGYVTGLIGKWHLGALDSRYHPNNRGFDEFVGFCGGWQDYYQWRLDYNGTPHDADGRYLTDVFTEEAVKFIRRHRREPFFLHLAYNAPHNPLQAPEEEIQPYRETGQFTEAVCRVYAMIEHMDAGIGHLLDELNRQGLADDTIFIFTSDNGPELGGQGENCQARFNCGFNGAKGNVYEGGIRVPLLIRWPEGLDGGRQFHEMVHFMDWLPTLAAAANVPLPNGLPLDGQNILPVLRGQPGRVCTRRFWQWNRYTPVIEANAAMRDGDWKLVRPVISAVMYVTREDLEMDNGLAYHPADYDEICRGPLPAHDIPSPPPPQLFNIAQDPEEATDLAAENPDRTQRMLRELETWFEQVEADRRNIPEADWF